jgi:hypothetical protein|tara:strand:+ start:84 stop:476 length:393 start_codon:yes stop_codon:yes gene_type:complete
MDIGNYLNTFIKAEQQNRIDGDQFGLGDLIIRLRELPQDMPILLGHAESYRGYYTDLAFVPLDVPRTVKEALEEAEEANGETFTGYKGGDFTMSRRTPVWLSRHGSLGTMIMGITDEGVLLTEYEDEDDA